MTILAATRPPIETQAVAMVSPTLKQPLTDHALDEPLWRISVARYHQMIKAGILTDDDPVELLEGLLVQKMPKNPAHIYATGLLLDNLPRLIPAGWYLNFQEPVTTANSEPEPDVAVIRGRRFDYRERLAGPEDTALVMEVADATLRRDRGLKKRLYARAGVPVYWIINLVKSQIEVYTEPDQQSVPPDYRLRRLYREGDRIPIVLDGTEVGQILVSDILPPPTANKNEGAL
jgi:Uma2 family endonuclease